MTKQRKSLSLSEENAEWLSQQDNASALVDRLVTEYRNGGGDEGIMLDYTRREVAAEVEYLRKSLEAKEDKLDYLDEKAEKVKPEWEKTIDEALELFDYGPITDKQAEHWADKANMDVEDFKQHYNEERQ